MKAIQITNKKISDLLRAFAKDERGVTSIEYGLIASATAVVLITALASIGTNLNTKWTAISSALN